MDSGEPLRDALRSDASRDGAAVASAGQGEQRIQPQDVAGGTEARDLPSGHGEDACADDLGHVCRLVDVVRHVEDRLPRIPVAGDVGERGGEPVAGIDVGAGTQRVDPVAVGLPGQEADQAVLRLQDGAVES